MTMTSPSDPRIESSIRRMPGRVLVAFDNSAGAEDALDWAIREAAARRSSLTAGNSEVLTGKAHNEDLLVFAAFAGTPVEPVLLASLAARATRRSPCPVVIVRGSSGGPLRRIVVGVDGSSAAEAALDWACHEANLHGATLVLLHARERAMSRVEARCVLDLAVNECRDRTDATVTDALVEGSPSSALIEASTNADIVAVGSRGRSGFKTAAFGPVTLRVAEGAHCPVAVTHPTLRHD